MYTLTFSRHRPRPSRRGVADALHDRCLSTKCTAQSKPTLHPQNGDALVHTQHVYTPVHSRRHVTTKRTISPRGLSIKEPMSHCLWIAHLKRIGRNSCACAGTLAFFAGEAVELCMSNGLRAFPAFEHSSSGTQPCWRRQDCSTPRAPSLLRHRRSLNHTRGTLC